jgi:hypothetical protein
MCYKFRIVEECVFSPAIAPGLFMCRRGRGFSKSERLPRGANAFAILVEISNGSWLVLAVFPVSGVFL